MKKYSMKELDVFLAPFQWVIGLISFIICLIYVNGLEIETEHALPLLGLSLPLCWLSGIIIGSIIGFAFLQIRDSANEKKEEKLSKIKEQESWIRSCRNGKSNS